MTDERRFSGEQFTVEERRRLRRELETLERLRPLLSTYENGRVVMKFLMVIAAWILGATATVLTTFGGLRYLNWWPFNGGVP